MKKIIVDTNIVFSAILNAKSNIGDIFFNGSDGLIFYSSLYLREEIERHRPKLLSLSGVTERELNEIIYQVFKKIDFISDKVLPFKVWAESVPYVRDIDIDDLPFVALTIYLDGLLWTGDKKLLKGLAAKGFEKTISTEELFDQMK